MRPWTRAYQVEVPLPRLNSTDGLGEYTTYNMGGVWEIWSRHNIAAGLHWFY